MFIHESRERAGARQDFIFPSHGAKGQNMNIMVRPFMNLNWKNLLLRSFAFSTSKKTLNSTLQPQCFKERNPLKQYCCPTGTQKLLCSTHALQFKFLHCWLSSTPSGSRGTLVMNTKPTARTAGKNLTSCLQLTCGTQTDVATQFNLNRTIFS